jgi:probable HAF family extracellular repeat protein
MQQASAVENAVNTRAFGEHTRYTMTILGGLGGTSSAANGINDRGWIIGWSMLNGSSLPEHEILWRKDRKVDLGTLGGPNSDAITPNKGNTGDVPGIAESKKDPLHEDFCFFGTGYACRGSDWRDGVMTALPTLGGNNAAALGSNDRGEIVGTAETDHRDSTCVAPQKLDFEAVVWEPRSHRAKKLPPLKGDRIGVAIAMNDRGLVVGGSGVCAQLNPADSVHPLLWKDGTPVSLPTLGGTMNNVAYAINDGGEIGGTSNLSGDTTTHATLWRSRAITDLGTLPRDASSAVNGMNNNGQIVGDSCDASGNCRGFLRQNGVMSDLNSLIPAHSRYYLMHAGDINDSGIIVGEAYDTKTGATPAFQATPTHVAVTFQSSPAIVLPEGVRRMFRVFGFMRTAPNEFGR